LTASDWVACIPSPPERVTASAPAIEKQKAAAAKTKESFRFIVIISAVDIIFIINEAIRLTNFKAVAIS
jgi:hypothetical protein